MFGNLVESSSHKGEYARRSRFFLGTLTVYALVFLALGVGSIYAYNTHIENQNLELVSLITPVETSQARTTPPRNTAPRQSAGGNNNSRIAVVRTPPAMTTMDPRHIPNKASVSSPVPELPSGTIYRVGIPGPNDNIFGSSGNRPAGDGPGDGTSGKSRELEELTRTGPPPMMETKASKPPATKPPRHIGVVNGMATDLPKPVYSAIAKAAGASGIVTVQVLIDESGKVISARAVSGHPLLQRESVQAAYRARFTPTLLSNQPVKVSGVITYNFIK
jgi:TonB family protein